jgi:hypothetical protein
MKRLSYALCAFLFALSATGCSTVAPNYSASIDNIAALKKAGDVTVKVGTFASSKNEANANPVSLRGSSLHSPYQDSYSDYVAEAIRQELTMAGMYAPESGIEVKGTLMKNDIDASGFSTGHANIQVRFIVRNGNTIRYNKVKTAEHEWESSFAGAIAIPRAVAEYHVVVSKVLGQLYSDPDFAAALQ